MTLRGDAAIYVDGPWRHRPVSANGTRFHIAENGEGPLVLLLHGFPQFWWTWRQQLETLAGAGYRAVAADLRGYGGSDKPPRGYDLVTAAPDPAGVDWAPGGRGHRGVAADLRGLGGRQKPPGGYQLVTGASDAAGLVRALGEANAVV